MNDPAASFAGCVYETARPRLHSEQAQKEMPGTRIELVQWEPPRDFMYKSCLNPYHSRSIDNTHKSNSIRQLRSIGDLKLCTMKMHYILADGHKMGIKP